MCSPATLAKLLEAISQPPAVVRRKYLILLAQQYGLPSLVQALDVPKLNPDNQDQRNYRRRQAAKRRMVA